MKVVFLDVDGVLNSNFEQDSHTLEMSSEEYIDEEKVRLLSEIIAKTSAAVVIHSGWRFWLNENLEPANKEATKLLSLLKQYDIKLFDKTPDLSTEEIKRTRKFSLVKASEIMAWLKNRGDINSWIVIDDLDLHNKYLADHQVKTNPLIGLTRKDVDLAVQLLNRFL